MPHIDRELVVFHSFHDLIWGLVKGDNVYLTPLTHGFCMQTTKCKCKNWVVAHNIFTGLCGTSLLYLTWYSCSVHFRLIAHFLSLHWSIAPCLRVGSEKKLKIPFKTDVCVHIWVMHCRLWLISHCTWKLHLCRQHWYKPFVGGIQTIYDLSYVYWCSNTTIDYNIIYVF